MRIVRLTHCAPGNKAIGPDKGRSVWMSRGSVDIIFRIELMDREWQRASEIDARGGDATRVVRVAPP